MKLRLISVLALLCAKTGIAESKRGADEVQIRQRLATYTEA
jgi:hypothetical protein